MNELIKLVEDYMQRFPDAESPMNLMNAFGQDRVIQILKEAKGREIEILSDDSRLDWQDFRYLPG